MKLQYFLRVFLVFFQYFKVILIFLRNIINFQFNNLYIIDFRIPIFTIILHRHFNPIFLNFIEAIFFDYIKLKVPCWHI
jgi:hypothetical protein